MVGDSELGWAWLAGFMDGEGSFFAIQEIRPANRSGFRMVPSVTVANTDIRSLHRAVEVTGCGRICNDKERRKRHKPVHRLTWNRTDVKRILPAMIPYLVLKKDRASLLLELCDLVTGTSNRYEQAEVNRIVWIYNELCRLNMRGTGEYRPKLPPAVRADGYIRSTKTCKTEGCKRKSRCLDMCNMHYKKMKYHEKKKVGQLALVAG